MVAWFSRFSEAYRRLKGSRWFHNLLIFLGFVMLAAAFWCVMALNDKFQDNLEVHLVVANTPDSVTFITPPPASIHVSVQDKGTYLMRFWLSEDPVLNLNFADFADDGSFKVSHAELVGALKGLFGTNASLGSVSVESLNLTYTTDKGRRVPVVVNFKGSAVNGFVIPAKPAASPRNVTVFASNASMDTITRVYTEPIRMRNLKDPYSLTVRVVPIPGVRVIPDRVEVSVPVEALVKKQSHVKIEVLNVPEDTEILLFPQKARVAYFVPMSRFNDDDPGIVVTADYNDISRVGSAKIPLKIDRTPSFVMRSSLIDTSVDYTIVKE